MATTEDGKPQTAPLIDIQIQISGSDALVLLVKPSTVRFRHCTVAAFSDPATLADASKAAEGSVCRVLPTLTPAIIQKLRIATDKEAKTIQKEWERAGFTLPSSPAASHHIVDVRFEEDEDAPVTPFPACAVLSCLGFDPLDTKLNSSGVVGALNRLQDDLKNATYMLLPNGGGGSGGASGNGGLVIKEMRRWDDTPRSITTKTLSAPAKTGFQSAADMIEEAAAPAAAAAAAPPSVVEKLGEVIDLSALQAGAGDGGENSGTIRIKKPHARAGPEVLSYLARLEKEEAAEAAAAAQNNPQKKKTGLPPSMAVAAQKAQAAPLKKVPLLGGKRALPTSAAATAQKTAKAPKKTAATGAGASGAAAAPKAPKAPAAEIDVASLNIPDLAATGKLSSLTIPQLKAYCRSIKQPVGGKKGDLENRIKTHLGIAI